MKSHLALNEWIVYCRRVIYLMVTMVYALSKLDVHLVRGTWRMDPGCSSFHGLSAAMVRETRASAGGERDWDVRTLPVPPYRANNMRRVTAMKRQRLTLGGIISNSSC